MPVFRLDADTRRRAARPRRDPRPLRARRERGVLVGTQMVAKGHDFPEVTLSVILDADATLRFPDFRAEERTFALVAQLAGRSGRGAAGGRCSCRRWRPDAPSIAHAARHDAAGFLAEELERRARPALPALLAPDRRSGLPAERRGRARRGRRAAARRSSPSDLRRTTDLLGPAPLFRLRAATAAGC